MNLGEWTEKILSMFREDGMTFGFAMMILDNTARKLKDEVIAEKVADAEKIQNADLRV